MEIYGKQPGARGREKRKQLRNEFPRKEEEMCNQRFPRQKVVSFNLMQHPFQPTVYEKPRSQPSGGQGTWSWKKTKAVSVPLHDADRLCGETVLNPLVVIDHGGSRARKGGRGRRTRVFFHQRMKKRIHMLRRNFEVGKTNQYRTTKTILHFLLPFFSPSVPDDDSG